MLPVVSQRRLSSPGMYTPQQPLKAFSMRGTNVLLLAVAVLSLLFGVYGFMFGGRLAAPPAANSVTVLDFAAKEAGALPDDPAPQERPAEKKAATPAPQAKLPDAGISDEVPAEGSTEQHRGRITGVVLDRGGAPVKGALVSGVDIEQLEVASLDLSAPLNELQATLDDLRKVVSDQLCRTTSGEDGRFELTNLNPDALYQVSAHSDRHGDDSAWEVRCGADLRLVFDAEGLLKVRVLDDEGRPLNRATVHSEGNDCSSWGTQRGVDGCYSIEWQDWFETVMFAARGYQVSRKFTRDDLTADDLEVRLKRAGSLFGVVSDLEGNPLPGANVSINSYVDADGQPAAVSSFCWDHYQSTDGKGRYFFDSLPPGTYTIAACVTSAGSMPIMTQEVSVNADAELNFSMDAGARLTVEVRGEEDRKFTSFSVSFSDKNGRYIDAAVIPGNAPGCRAFYGLPRDQLQVTVSASGYSPVRLPADLAGGESHLTFTLNKGALVEGMIVDASGNALTALRTRWTPAGKDPGEAADVWIYAWDGKFSGGPLAPGAWIVDVYVEGFLGEKLASQTVQLAAGKCELSLVVDCRRVLQIQVGFDDGLSDEWIEVFVRRDGVEEWESYDIDEDNPTRSLRLAGLAEGRYFVYATTDRCSSPVETIELKDRPVKLTVTLKKPDCVRLTSVEDGSNAALHGLKEGDLLLEYDYQPVTSLADLVRLTKLADGREDVCIAVQRNGRKLELKVNGGLLGVSAAGATR